MNYGIDDLVYWSGFMAATACVYLLLQAVVPDWHRLVMLILSFLAGAGAGYSCLILYAWVKQPKQQKPLEEHEDEKW